MKIILNSTDTSAKFALDANTFALLPAGSSARSNGRSVKFTVSEGQAIVSLCLAPKTLEKEAQTERLNRALALGYMPALRTTTA